MLPLFSKAFERCGSILIVAFQLGKYLEHQLILLISDFSISGISCLLKHMDGHMKIWKAPEVLEISPPAVETFDVRWTGPLFPGAGLKTDEALDQG